MEKVKKIIEKIKEVEDKQKHLMENKIISRVVRDDMIKKTISVLKRHKKTLSNLCKKNNISCAVCYDEANSEYYDDEINFFCSKNCMKFYFISHKYVLENIIINTDEEYTTSDETDDDLNFNSDEN